MYAMRRQKGMTLIEIMIGLLVGAVITGGAISVYNNTLKSNTDNLNLARINQDLRGMMDIMVRDIRRAGYVTDQLEKGSGVPVNDSDGDGINDDLTNNPFTDSTTPGATTDITVIGGDCILYTYNRDSDQDNGGVSPEIPAFVDNNEFLGFKLEDNQLKMRKSGSNTSNCSIGSEWEDITEPEVEITGLNFTLAEDAYNVTSMMTDSSTPPDGVMDGDTDGNGTCDPGEACHDDCTPDGSPGPACIFTRAVTISLTGRLKSDHAVTQTLNEEVRIRNDKYVAALP